jgi:YHS domain-containing protein
MYELREDVVTVSEFTDSSKSRLAMSEIDEFKAKLRGEAEAARERIREMQAQAAEQYREMQSNYVIFLDLSQRIREAIRPWVEAFAEALPDVTPVVTERDFGPAGRVFHGGFVTFSLPRSERCPANITLRFGLEAGVAVDSLILFYDLEIVPVFIEFERHDQIALPLYPSSVERAVEWFKEKALAFTKTYVSMFFNPYYQKGSEVPDVVLGRTFPRAFAKGQTEYRGVTYHFLTEESRKAFEQDPTRYVGSS